MKGLETRADIEVLVNAFYAKIRTDELLGPIFNSHIADERWPEHLSNLADFWETSLFGVARFKGRPTQKHMAVDKNLKYGISQVHFGTWLHLWHETIDELYTGEYAQKAKDASRKMATGQFVAIWKNRPENV